MATPRVEPGSVASQLADAMNATRSDTILLSLTPQLKPNLSHPSVCCANAVINQCRTPASATEPLGVPQEKTSKSSVPVAVIDAR